MLLVGNVDRSVDFYTRLLGMDVQRVRDLPPAGERVRYVGGGEEDDGAPMELIEPPKTRGSPARWGGQVALDVSDCYKLCERRKAEGVQFVSGPGRNRPGSRDV